MDDRENIFFTIDRRKIEYADFFSAFQEFSINNQIPKQTKNLLFNRILITLEEYGYNINSEK